MALLFASPIAAQPVVIAQQNPIMAQVQKALSERDFRTVLTLADELLPVDPFQAHMLAARVFFETNQLNHAKTAVNRAKLVRPKSAEARILDGLILQRQGRTAAAELALRRAIDLGANAREKAIARNFLRQTQAARKWKLTGGFGFAPSTNIGKKTSASSFLSFFGTFTLDDPSISSGVGLRLFAGAGRDIAKFSKGRLRFDANLGANVYDASGFDTRSGQVRLSYIVNPKPMSQTAYFLGYDFGSFRSGETEMETAKLGFTHTQFLDPAGGPRRGLRFSAEHSKRNWTNVDPRDSQANNLSVTYFHPLSNYTQLSAGIVAERRKSISAEISNQFTMLTLGADFRAKNSGFITSVNASYKNASWEFSGILPQPREDDEYSFAVTVRNPNVSYFGLTPSFTASYLLRESNSALYDVKSTDFFIGLTNAF